MGYEAQMKIRKKIMMRYFYFVFATVVERHSFVFVFVLFFCQLNYACLLILDSIFLCYHWGSSKLLFLLLLKIN